MKRIIIKRLIIISQTEKKAKILDFDSKLNIFNSQKKDGSSFNRTGKSLALKSLVSAFGVKLKKTTKNWIELNICTIVNFTIDNVVYKLFRNQDMFIISYNGEEYVFPSIGKFRRKLIELVNFKIKLENNNKNDYMYPGAIFLPYYIDQDEGWNGEWNSFSDVFCSSWKNEILQYHMGIKTNRYYEIKENIDEIKRRIKMKKEKLDLYRSFYDNKIEKHKQYLSVNVKLNDFKNEIVELTSEINNQSKKKNELKVGLLKCINELEEENNIYVNAVDNLKELTKDIDFINIKLNSETLKCPTCGVIHKNNISNRFVLFKDIEKCNNAIKSYHKNKKNIENKIDIYEKEINNLNHYINSINHILNKKQKNIKFETVLKATGSWEMIKEIKTDINELNTNINLDTMDKKELQKEKNKISKEGKKVEEKYLELLKENIFKMQIGDINIADISKFKKKLECGGNDTPIAIIAQIYAIYSTAICNDSSCMTPIILDAIFQQEPAKLKKKEIWEFLIDRQPEQSQLFLSTTELDQYNTKDAKIFTFTNKKNLLNTKDFNKVEEEYKKINTKLLVGL